MIIEPYKNHTITWQIIPRNTISLNGMQLALVPSLDHPPEESRTIDIPLGNGDMTLMVGDTLNCSYHARDSAMFCLLAWLFEKRNKPIIAVLRLTGFPNTWPQAGGLEVNVYHTFLHIKRCNSGSPEQHGA